MTSKNLSKLIFLLYCFISLTFVRSPLGLQAMAVAQASISSENTQEYAQNLSASQKADLKQGKVILQGQKGSYYGRILAKGDTNTAWEVLTDYNNFARFLPNISSSKIIAQQGDRVVFEQVNVVDLWLFQQEFAVQIEAIKNKPTKVDFKIVDGDLKKLIGRWEIEEIASGKILISHAVEVEPGSNTEKPFFYGVYESSLEETLQAIAREVSQRSHTMK